MRVIAVINRSAGSLVYLPHERRADHIKELFHNAGIESEVLMVEATRIKAVAREAARLPVDAICAGGGDGTISTVAGIAAENKMPLGVLPLGTLNHFAKDLGIPLELADAIGVIAAGRLRAVDIGEVNRIKFINNSSIGLYPHIVKERDMQRAKLGRGKWLAMASAILYMLRRFPQLRVRLAIGGQEIQRTTPFVFIGNNRYQMDLFTLGSRARLDNCELSMYVANKTGRFGLLRLALMALLGRLDQAADFDSVSAQELWIETKKRKQLRVALDGEVIRLRPPLHYQIRPRALRVFVPPEEDAGETG
jgi:YegS/Rv2252/BmrU family lipid kinase